MHHRSRPRRRPVLTDHLTSAFGQSHPLAVVLVGLPRIEPDDALSSGMSPSVNPSARASASVPTTSPASWTWTWRFNCSPSAVATGASGNFGSGPPPGLPRCAVCHHLGAGIGQRLQRGHRGDDSARVGDGGPVEAGRWRSGRPARPSTLDPRPAGRRCLDRHRGYSDLPTRPTRSTKRFSSPHSLSYHDTALTWLPDHLGQAGVEDRAVRVGDDVMLNDRRVVVLPGCLSLPSAAAFIAALMSSALASLSTRR